MVRCVACSSPATDASIVGVRDVDEMQLLTLIEFDLGQRGKNGRDPVGSLDAFAYVSRHGVLPRCAGPSEPNAHLERRHQRLDAPLKTRVPRPSRAGRLRDAEIQARMQCRSLWAARLRNASVESWMERISRRACLSADGRRCRHGSQQNEAIGFRHGDLRCKDRQHGQQCWAPADIDQL